MDVKKNVGVEEKGDEEVQNTQRLVLILAYHFLRSLIFAVPHVRNFTIPLFSILNHFRHAV